MSEGIFIGGDRRSIAEKKQDEINAAYSSILDTDTPGNNLTKNLADNLAEVRKSEREIAERARILNKWHEEQITSRDAVKAQLEKEGITGAVDLSEEFYKKVSKKQDTLYLGRETDDARGLQRGMSKDVSNVHVGLTVTRNRSTGEMRYGIFNASTDSETKLSPNGDPAKTEVVKGEVFGGNRILNDGDVFVMGKKDAYQFRLIEGHPIVVPKPDFVKDKVVVTPEADKKPEVRPLSVHAVSLDDAFDLAKSEYRYHVVIGRKDGSMNNVLDIELPRSKANISRKHLKLTKDESGDYVAGLFPDVTNPTYLERDGEQPKKMDVYGAKLVDGDRIVVGYKHDKASMTLVFRKVDGKGYFEATGNESLGKVRSKENISANAINISRALDRGSLSPNGYAILGREEVTPATISPAFVTRDEVQLLIPNVEHMARNVSRKHLGIKSENGKFFVTDLSTNGAVIIDSETSVRRVNFKNGKFEQVLDGDILVLGPSKDNIRYKVRLNQGEMFLEPLNAKVPVKRGEYS